MVSCLLSNVSKLIIRVIADTRENKFNLPDNIDIVTTATTDIEGAAPLTTQLQKNGYSYINAVPKVIAWAAYKKIKYIYEGLKQCTKEYALVLDASDVTIFSDLDEIFERFNSYGKDIIYNASIWMFPQNTIIEYVENRGQYGDYCWLNAGCCFGKTKALIDFYKEILEDIETDAHPVMSEQYYVRKHFDKHQDTIFFDYNCKIFQCWHKQRFTEEEIQLLDGTTENRRQLLY